MKRQHITRVSQSEAAQDKSASDWMRVDAQSESALDASICEDADEGPDHLSIDWTMAEIGLPRRKEMVNMRLDPDVIDWFKAQGRGYQTRINSVLKAFVEAKSGT